MIGSATNDPQSSRNHAFQALLFETVALGQQLRNRGRVLESEGVSGVAMTLLENLADKGPQTVPQLARAGMTSRQNIQVQVNRLSQTGWVEMRENPAHRKSGLVALTAEGQSRLSANTEALHARWRSQFADLNEEQIATALDTIRIIRRGIESNLNPARTARKARTETPESSEPLTIRPALPAEPSPRTEEEDLPVSLL